MGGAAQQKVRDLSAGNGDGSKSSTASLCGKADRTKDYRPRNSGTWAPQGRARRASYFRAWPQLARGYTFVVKPRNPKMQFFAPIYLGLESEVKVTKKKQHTSRRRGKLQWSRFDGALGIFRKPGRQTFKKGKPRRAWRGQAGHRQSWSAPGKKSNGSHCPLGTQVYPGRLSCGRGKLVTRCSADYGPRGSSNIPSPAGICART